MTTRREFIARSAALAGSLLALPATAQAPYGVVRELSGQVFLNDLPMGRTHAILPGQTVSTGADGRVWFTLGADAYFLRPGSRLRVEPSATRETLAQALRLLTGALGATFERGAMRMMSTHTVTIGIRGTGVYLEAAPQETYACNCFGAVDLMSSATGAMMEPVRVSAQNHQARRILRDPQAGIRIVAAAFERHTSEEMVRLEALAGRPSPFSS